jgi:hypothetical protein
MKKRGSCGNCARGIKIHVNRDILCKIHGIVSRDFRCARYVRKVETWPSSEIKAKCIECEFFISAPYEPQTSPDQFPQNPDTALSQQPSYESEQDPSMGHCQLFTVRQFDGEHKNACSKFCRKSERNIS